MTWIDDPDAVVVGAGPNGLAAAVTLARAGLRVQVVERAATAGGGARTEALTLPGHLHDVCSAVHPMAFASGFFRRFGLRERVDFAVPELSYGHPLDGGRAALAWRDLDRTVDALGVDGDAWRRLMGPLAHRAQSVARLSGSNLLVAPRQPLVAARFAARLLAEVLPTHGIPFRADAAPALLAGVAAHAIQPIGSIGSAAAGLALATHGHAAGWPIPIGGSRAIVDALVADLVAHGGAIETDHEVRDVAEFSGARAVLADVTPRILDRIAADRLPASYRRRLARFRYGAGIAKVDLVLDGAVPWTAPDLDRAGTVHVGGTRAEITAAEADVAAGRHAERPYVLVSQPSRFDASRAPAGHHVVWTYAHVPAGSRVDQRDAVLDQLERFAPGVRDRVVAVSSRTAIDVERHDPLYHRGDIAGGAADLRQLVARPTFGTDPWRTPARGLYLCSSSTPPGPGVHGLAGWYAARSALRHEFGIHEAPDLAPEPTGPVV